MSASRNHYSYSTYADTETARTFDARRFGGPIGDLVATAQADALIQLVGAVRGQTVLDAGTGTGRAALLLAERGARVTAMDASNEMLAVARRRAADQRSAIEFRTGDLHALEFPDCSFDVAVSLRVLMHTPRWEQCLGELCRVSRRLVVIDYPSARSFAAIEAGCRRVASRLGVDTEAYRVFLDGTIASAFERQGFRVGSSHRQFVLPIALHKALGSRPFTTAVEGALNRIGLLGLAGSPVTIAAERCESS